MKKQEMMLKFAPATEADIKDLADKPDGFIAGWASTSGMDSCGHVVKAGAFSESIEKNGIKGPKGIKLLIGHDWDKPAGVITMLEYRGEDLWIEAQLNLNISYARDMYEAAKMNGGMNYSVGFFREEYEWKKNKDGDTYMLIEKGSLFEVSVVPFPANEECTMDYIKSMDDELNTVADFEKHLVSKGLAKGRNEANRITHEVKSALHLFQKTDPTPEVEEVEEIAPMLAAGTIKKLSAKIEELKAITRS